MLVLSRKKNESITIGGNTVVTVISIQPDSVEIVVDAPEKERLERKAVTLKGDLSLFLAYIPARISLVKIYESGPKARLGIDAPKDITVHRTEIADLL